MRIISLFCVYLPLFKHNNNNCPSSFSSPFTGSINTAELLLQQLLTVKKSQAKRVDPLLKSKLPTNNILKSVTNIDVVSAAYKQRDDVHDFVSYVSTLKLRLSHVNPHPSIASIASHPSFAYGEGERRRQSVIFDRNASF